MANDQSSQGGDATRLSAGARLDDYEIVAPVKAGGMAQLYLGKRADSRAGSFFAIKVLHEHLSTDRDHVRMFRNEALLSSRIRHPNVVTVRDVGFAAVCTTW